jgi:hypothetical protein
MGEQIRYEYNLIQMTESKGENEEIKEKKIK